MRQQTANKHASHIYTKGGEGGQVEMNKQANSNIDEQQRLL